LILPVKIKNIVMELLNKLLSINPNYILGGLIILFFSLEMAFRRPIQVGAKVRHFVESFLFQLFAIALGGLVGFIIVTTFDWIKTNNFGLFNWISVPFWFKIIAGIFMIDFADYWFHRFDHKIPILWRLHRVHHSDTTMDASTAIRQFPTEPIYFTIGELIIAVIFGIDIISMNIFLFLLLPVLFIQHTSITYPLWADKAFGWILLMPNFHKIHHDQDQFYTDSNYGTLFSIWDRLFGTFKTKPMNEVIYGLKEFEGNKKQSFLYLAKSPFINIKRVEAEEPLYTKDNTSAL
jgi:sterol desaturase/sphingolipid hydroxylase (fatty acid hydroxylase superfamily)